MAIIPVIDRFEKPKKTSFQYTVSFGYMIFLFSHLESKIRTLSANEPSELVLNSKNKINF